MKITELTREEAHVYSILPVGKKNAIKRSDLAYVLGLSDRAARKLVERLNDKQHTVCNLMDGEGYYIPADEIEHLEYERIINSYKCSLQRKEYSIKRARERKYGERKATYTKMKKRRQKSLQGA